MFRTIYECLPPFLGKFARSVNHNGQLQDRIQAQDHTNLHVRVLPVLTTDGDADPFRDSYLQRPLPIVLIRRGPEEGNGVRIST